MNVKHDVHADEEERPRRDRRAQPLRPALADERDRPKRLLRRPAPKSNEVREHERTDRRRAASGDEMPVVPSLPQTRVPIEEAARRHLWRDTQHH